jgi:hypothetical protein
MFDIGYDAREHTVVGQAHGRHSKSYFDRLKLDIRCDVKLINTGLKHNIRPPVLSYLYFFN